MYRDKGEINNKHGTFIVKVDRCQNETWQGRVVWADEERTEHFRSTLELLKLMDQALNASHRQESESIDSA
jgi:hypothetical protein